MYIYIYIHIYVCVCVSNSIEWGSSDEFCGTNVNGTAYSARYYLRATLTLLGRAGPSIVPWQWADYM